MQTFLGLLICCVLITAGTALECEVCTSLGTSCTGSLQTCESGKDTCAIMLSVDTLLGSPTETIAKKCASSSTCENGPKYMNFGQGKGIRYSITCCTGEACTSVIPQLPPDITTGNGKRCPACYTTASSPSCNEGEMVDCVGPEDHCFGLALRITYESVVLNAIQRGCVSKSICDNLQRSEKKSPNIVVTTAECTPA